MSHVFRRSLRTALALTSSARAYPWARCATSRALSTSANDEEKRAEIDDDSEAAARDAYSANLAMRAARARKMGTKIGEASSERVSATMRADGTAPKFYEEVSVRRDDASGTWRVTLDERLLRTPRRNEYTFGTKALAVAIAMEWDAQTDHVAPFTMPLTQLSATALDHMWERETRELHVETLLKHFRTDVVRVRSMDEAVAKRQVETHAPILKWAEKEFGEVEVSDSIFGPETSDKTLEVLRKRLNAMCPWELTCAFALSAATKSLLIGLKTLRGELSVDEAIAAARVEEETQIEEWGLVEGGHDLDQLDIRVKVAAPVMLMKLRADNGE